MGRKIVAVFAGVFAAGLVILAVEVIAHQLVVAQRNGEPTLPMLLFVATAWLLGSMAGALIAQRIDHSRLPVPALLVGAILLALAIYNLVVLPHPTWFRVVGVLVFIPGTVLGIFFGRRRQRHRRAATW